jgi:hypothetical protein
VQNAQAGKTVRLIDTRFQKTAVSDFTDIGVSIGRDINRYWHLIRYIVWQVKSHYIRLSGAIIRVSPVFGLCVGSKVRDIILAHAVGSMACGIQHNRLHIGATGCQCGTNYNPSDGRFQNLLSGL